MDFTLSFVLSLRLSKMFSEAADLVDYPVRRVICADVGEPGATVRHVVAAAAALRHSSPSTFAG